MSWQQRQRALTEELAAELHQSDVSSFGLGRSFVLKKQLDIVANIIDLEEQHARIFALEGTTVQKSRLKRIHESMSQMENLAERLRNLSYDSIYFEITETLRRQQLMHDEERNNLQLALEQEMQRLLDLREQTRAAQPDEDIHAALRELDARAEEIKENMEHMTHTQFLGEFATLETEMQRLRTTLADWEVAMVRRGDSSSPLSHSQQRSRSLVDNVMVLEREDASLAYVKDVLLSLIDGGPRVKSPQNARSPLTMVPISDFRAAQAQVHAAQEALRREREMARKQVCSRCSMALYGRISPLPLQTSQPDINLSPFSRHIVSSVQPTRRSPIKESPANAYSEHTSVDLIGDSPVVRVRPSGSLPPLRSPTHSLNGSNGMIKSRSPLPSTPSRSSIVPQRSSMRSSAGSSGGGGGGGLTPLRTPPPLPERHHPTGEPLQAPSSPVAVALRGVRPPSPADDERRRLSPARSGLPFPPVQYPPYQSDDGKHLTDRERNMLKALRAMAMELDDVDLGLPAGATATGDEDGDGESEGEEEQEEESSSAPETPVVVRKVVAMPAKENARPPPRTSAPALASVPAAAVAPVIIAPLPVVASSPVVVAPQVAPAHTTLIETPTTTDAVLVPGLTVTAAPPAPSPVAPSPSAPSVWDAFASTTTAPSIQVQSAPTSEFAAAWPVVLSPDPLPSKATTASGNPFDDLLNETGEIGSLGSTVGAGGGAPEHDNSSLAPGALNESLDAAGNRSPAWSVEDMGDEFDAPGNAFTTFV